MATKKTYETPVAEHKIRHIQLSENTALRIIVEEYTEKESLDVRIWYRKKDDTEYNRTSKGVKLDLRHLAGLQDAINKAVAISEKNDLNIGEVTKPKPRSTGTRRGVTRRVTK